MALRGIVTKMPLARRDKSGPGSSSGRTVTAVALHELALSTGKAILNADVVAPKPNPDSLAGAIFSYEEK
ncbi:hypothetical protein CCR75_003122 [Bremia lactucae]|uniref:Uncharacterized protein n=1 Tax=Bremia lactucae TaxID=4779 RepID=A0A976ICQ4_BRELC|nr:hypothetical protein CCR75_003122 [Bremia lactucae]